MTNIRDIKQKKKEKEEATFDPSVCKCFHLNKMN